MAAEVILAAEVRQHGGRGSRSVSVAAEISSNAGVVRQQGDRTAEVNSTAHFCELKVTKVQDMSICLCRTRSVTRTIQPTIIDGF
ncbi:hypothetical protein SAMD00019534_073130 [Acytostelium subglobosum LB1]|uniref:hypothetical protein n=1 Tax=Acytostelium subglobosum LB1 TaxID=1410327 RepID=UPI000644841F|nr:hypothetical protein SAMD00019534_073130 [Acytostelium subglobosum LB1]GAM24138.1 hypothetical protein SAMD00019534_073130 [Acytostelium subglobosum LB1]|eukprot:XP_012753174.1 hypothetical protein SAMD00019534_073130 [Acytostelium subglobosum LB1]